MPQPVCLFVNFVGGVRNFATASSAFTFFNSYMDYKYFDYDEVDDFKVTEDGGEREEVEEQRLHEMFTNVCSIITELIPELNDLLEDLLKKQ